EHWIYFASEAERSQFVTIVGEEGFSVEDLSKDEEHELPYKAQISRLDKVTPEATDDYILKLWQLAQDYKGNYDGWETFIVKE
ncbi:MAG: ribonuclease E inhibitor RraB, partial [Pyrinomonadaceae bacterium]